MKKLIIILLLFVLCTPLFANDYRWDLVNALSRNDYPAAENIINRNINTLVLQERRQILNFAVTYSHGDTALSVMQLMERYNVLPGAFDLYTAINRNQPDSVISFILNHGVTANGEILLLAMEKRRLDLAKQFIQAGADVNYQYPLSRNDTDGMTALLYASRYGNFELVRLLVDRGADINARNREGNTALSIAQAAGNTQISNYLIESGASRVTAVPAQPGQTQPNQPGGIGALMGNTTTAEFQPGNYRLSGANQTAAAARDLSFSGSANIGRVGFIRNNRTYSGSYQVAGENLTVIMDGRIFVYKIDSNTSFSGNGEVWVRTGN